ncbi:MAG TPA: hypothetical protein VHY48_08985 [Acidobacteriaceae bacterium]|jgi:hypothetical protein|nr:hypothetical protein [Acidobacteriaceae bacterium]
MANTLLPAEERTLTPAEVDALDRRRRRGQTYLVLGFEFLIIAVLVTCWAGQDATYSPGWARPMLDWDILLFVLSAFCIVRGIRLRRGVNEFFSY